MPLLLLFVDGLGLGPEGACNPLGQMHLPGMQRLSGGEPLTNRLRPTTSYHHHVGSLDATLGVDGLPQSGTGQATLFTGVNCAAVAGRHYGPFPHSSSRPIIGTQSIFVRLHEQGASTAFANAYPDRFFSYVETTNRWTVTTLSCKTAGVPLRGESALQAGAAIPANLTGVGWPGDPFHPIDEVEAASRLLSIASEHDFTLFEYFLTDKAGHGRGNVDATHVLASLDAFIEAIALDRPADLTVVLTSDHGNLEDLSTRSHTLNRVPLLVHGPGAAAFANATSLLDVAPAVITVARGS